MRYQYFIASRWRNRDQVLELVQKLRDKGKTVYNFFEATDTAGISSTDPEVHMEHFEARSWQHDQYVKDAFEKDMAAEKESENVIMLLPGGKSAHIEIGVAHGLGKKCILIGEQQEAESLYLIFDETYPTIDVFIQSLQ